MTNRRKISEDRSASPTAHAAGLFAARSEGFYAVGGVSSSGGCNTRLLLKGCDSCDKPGRWFNDQFYPSRTLMCQARRLEYVRLIVEEGLNYTQAARQVGVSKRIGKVWRNGRTRATGRNEHASVHVSAHWYRQHMLPIEQINVRCLSQSERLSIADRLRLGDSIRTIARILNRSASPISRQIRNNTYYHSPLRTL